MLANEEGIRTSPHHEHRRGVLEHVRVLEGFRQACQASDSGDAT